MKLKKDLVLREVAGQHLIMPVGRLSQICKMMRISSTAAFIYRVMEEGEFTEDSLVERGMREFTGVAEERLRNDIHKFLQLLDENFMLESGKPEPIMGVVKINLNKKQKKNLQEMYRHGSTEGKHGPFSEDKE